MAGDPIPLIDGPRRDAASGAATALIVLLHGYGANGDDLFGLVDPLSGVLPHVAFASPNAPQRSSMSPMGYQWFPIPWIDGSSEADSMAAFAVAVTKLDAFLDAEMARHGVDETRTALFGFSQGAMMSLHVAPRRAKPFAAVAAFSGRLLAPERLSGETVSRPEILLAHGDQDDVVPPQSLVEARTALAGAGFTVDWHISRGVGHGIAPDGLQAAAQLFQRTLPPVPR